MKKSTSKQTKVKKDQTLWQEIPETAQDKIAGGRFDAFIKVVSQADADGTPSLAGRLGIGG